MKRILSLLLVCVLALSLCISAGATEAMSNFKAQNSYDSKFTDVKDTDWFAPYVKTAFEYGLVNGKNSDTTFCPNDQFTVAEALKVAACVHSIYTNGTVSADNSTFQPTAPWYSVYAEYCANNGIIKDGDFTDFNAPCTRGEMAYIFSNCLPAEELAAMREVTIPDCDSNTKYLTNIQTLYNAGVVSGDETHAYHPTDPIKRSEMAKILCTLTTPSMRDTKPFDSTVSPTPTADATALFAQFKGKVFELTSGVGGWSDDLAIDETGKFTQNYHDSDMGDTGDGYPNGTVSVSASTGQFGDVQKVSDLEYTMKVLSCTSGYEKDKSYVEEGIRYVALDPTLPEGTTLQVYLTGYEVSKLPAACYEWLAMPNAWSKDTAPKTLPFDVLYDSVNERAYFSMPAETEEAAPVVE